MQSEILKTFDPDDLPHFGYVYFLVTAADPQRQPAADAATHVKIGASDVPVRRMKSIPIPIDWERSLLMRFQSWDQAYAAEQVLHQLLAGDCDPEFLQIPPSRQKTVHRIREAEAGKTEYFRIAALAKAQAIMESDRYRRLFQWNGRALPALDIIPRQVDGGALDKPHHNYQKSCRLIARLAALDAGLVIAAEDNPARDGYRGFVVSADLALLQKGHQLALPFSDGRAIPLFGDAIALRRPRLFAAEIMPLRPDHLERGRELSGMGRLHDMAMRLPIVPELPRQASLALVKLGGLGRTAALAAQFAINPRVVRRPGQPEYDPGRLLDGCAPC